MEQQYTDYFGNPLEVGDPVVYMSLISRSLREGTIKKITPKMVFIGFEEPRSEDVKQFHDQVINKKYVNGIF